MKRLVLAMLAVPILGVGMWVCSRIEWGYAGRMMRGETSPQVDRRYVLSSDATIYFKIETFRADAMRHEAGTTASYADWRSSLDRGEQMPLGKGAILKVVEAIEGGAKVVVTSGDEEEKGKIGWVDRDTLIIFADRIKK